MFNAKREMMNIWNIFTPDFGYKNLVAALFCCYANVKMLSFLVVIMMFFDG